MKKKLTAVAAALLLIASNAVCAAADWGWGYDYNDYDYSYDYGYDNTWDNGQTWDDGQAQTWDNGQTAQTNESASDSSAADSQADEPLNAPVSASFTLSGIVEKKFTADLKIDSLSKLTAIDLTITYDPAVLKLTSSKANKKAGGTGAAAELEPGTVQYQYTNQEGSEWKDSYLTLGFEITDPSVRSTVIYMTANSVLNEYSTPLTARTDGTIVQIEGAVEFDAKDDESMYSELRVTKSAQPISYESLGLANVTSVTFEDPSVASTMGTSITTLSTGLTNMTVEFADGTKKYYRLVVSDSAPAPVTTAAGTVAPDAAAGQQGQQTAAADPNAAATAPAPAVTDANGAAVPAPAAAPADQGVIKTETRSTSRVKYLIIYILVLVALIAIVVEFFVFFGNPYSKTFKLLKKRKAEGAPVTEGMPDPGVPDVPDTLSLDDEDDNEDENMPFLETDENTSEDDAYEDYEQSPDEYDDEEYEDDGYGEYEDSSAVYHDPDTEQPDDSAGYDTADGEIVDDEDDEYEYTEDDEEEFEEEEEEFEEEEFGEDEEEPDSDENGSEE